MLWCVEADNDDDDFYDAVDDYEKFTLKSSVFEATSHKSVVLLSLCPVSLSVCLSVCLCVCVRVIDVQWSISDESHQPSEVSEVVE